MSIDLDKPISSKLDLDDGFSSEPASADDLLLSQPLTEAEIAAMQKLSDNKNSTVFTPPLDNTEANPVMTKPAPDKQMQAVAPPETAAAVQPQKVIKLKKEPKMPTIRADESQPPVVPWKSNSAQITKAPGKVNLEKQEELPKMPTIRADASQPPVQPWEPGNDGDNEENEAQQNLNAGVLPQNRRLGMGTVNFAFSDRKNIILIAVAFLVIFFGLSIILRAVGSLDTEFTLTIIMFGITFFGIAANFIRSGESWHYEATGREIIFSRKGRPSQIIFFKDALSVDYAPYKFFGIIETGYLVTVLTYGKKYEFRYVYPNLMRKLSFDLTPFEIIRRQIDQLGLNNTAI